MKFFKITLRQNKGSKDLIYPANYQAEIGNFNVGHLYFSEGEEQPRLLICVKNVNAVNTIREYVEEITEKEAKKISEANETREETITNEAKIRRIELKAKIGKVLTPEEEKAIDLNDPMTGFNMSKILADKIDEIKYAEEIDIPILENSKVKE